MKTIEEFCNTHNACRDGRKWALKNCQTMTDAWATAKPEWLLWVATRPGVLTDRELRLFAVFCARSCEHLLADQRNRDAIDVAERHANGLASEEELAAARAAARDAARAAASDAAWDAASAAAWDAASAAAWDAASAAASAAQSAWLRENTAPNF